MIHRTEKNNAKKVMGTALMKGTLLLRVYIFNNFFMRDNNFAYEEMRAFLRPYDLMAFHSM